MGIICFNLQYPRQLLKSKLDMFFVFAPTLHVHVCTKCIYLFLAYFYSKINFLKYRRKLQCMHEHVNQRKHLFHLKVIGPYIFIIHNKYNSAICILD